MSLTASLAVCADRTGWARAVFACVGCVHEDQVHMTAFGASIRDLDRFNFGITVKRREHGHLFCDGRTAVFEDDGTSTFKVLEEENP